MNPIRAAIGCALATVILLACGCKTAPDGPPAAAPISHVVLAALKDPAQADALISDCDSLLRQIPTVRSYSCGRHIDTGRGEKVNAAYDVGLVVGFNTVADYKAYDASPQHQELLRRWAPKIKTLTIYDIADVP